MKLQIQKTLPEVITREQVQQVIEACHTPRIAACLWTIYSLGLRIEEGRNLQVGDIDSARMMVHVHRGKGAKDRYVPLPHKTRELLGQYWLTHQNPLWLFPALGRGGNQGNTAIYGPDIAAYPYRIEANETEFDSIASG